MTGKSTKGTRRKYGASFKEDVLKMVATGRSVSDVAQALGIGTHIIYRWLVSDGPNIFTFCVAD